MAAKLKSSLARYRRRGFLPTRQTETSDQETVEALVASIGEGLIVVDQYGHIRQINDSALNILGYKLDELAGAWLPRVLPSFDIKGKKIPNTERPIMRALLTGKPVAEIINYRRKDGSLVPIYGTASPFLIKGQPKGVIIVFRDITKELQIEKSKNEFIALTSHQLRTPATAVKQYLGMLLEGYSDPLTKGQRDFLKKAYDSTEHQLRIVDDILRVAQVDLNKLVLRKDRHDLRLVIKEAAAALSALIKDRGQKLTMVIPKRPVWAEVDFYQLILIMENLLENASNYTPPKGRIGIKLAKVKDSLCLSVEDSGVGIAPKDQALLFQKFSRIRNDLSDSVNGTGLGLYYCQKIVQLHGGKIKVRSKVGQGSSFTVVLPAKLGNFNKPKKTNEL